MIELETYVKELAIEEEKEDIKEHGYFHSNHEGIAILQEEVWEAKQEFDKIKGKEKVVKIAIYNNAFDDKSVLAKTIAQKAINDLKEHAIKGACELIQVAAMCDKFTKSRQERGDE